MHEFNAYKFHHHQLVNMANNILVSNVELPSSSPSSSSSSRSSSISSLSLSRDMDKFVCGGGGGCCGRKIDWPSI
ncbi:hypothetical protein DERF_014917 [Dermatophagoides farinae]|uniref:Uncharacterized protein n=1 Tax=Dermatophagoides farinae TaxID=6954 RepID=A0A922HKI4_DERFA|nr:hypothetical protein DERF_014917 [Dermatophagoides farinae]